LLPGNWHKVVCFSLFVWVVQWADGISALKAFENWAEIIKLSLVKQSLIINDWDIFLGLALIGLN